MIYGDLKSFDQSKKRLQNLTTILFSGLCYASGYAGAIIAFGVGGSLLGLYVDFDSVDLSS